MIEAGEYAEDGAAAMSAAAPRRARPTLGRVLAIGAPIVYVASLTISILINGAPIARDQMFLWLLLGMAACSISAWRRWGLMLLEWLPFFGLLVAYDYLRGAASVADQNAHILPQIAFERVLTLGGEIPTVWLQERLYDPDRLPWYDVAAWCVYMTHFFVIWIVAAVLWQVAHDRFRRYIAVLVTLTLFGYLTYWLYPAQPPWLTSQIGEIGPVSRIVPSVWGHLGFPTAQTFFETGDGLVNLVAAMPSLHAAYPFMLLLFFWSSGWWVQAGLGLYTLAMAFALVYGGEHFVVDVLFGYVLALLAFAVVDGVPRVAAWVRR